MRFEIDQTQCKQERPCQDAVLGDDGLWYVELSVVAEVMALIAEVDKTIEALQEAADDSERGA